LKIPFRFEQQRTKLQTRLFGIKRRNVLLTLQKDRGFQLAKKFASSHDRPFSPSPLPNAALCRKSGSFL
jgi:hypothetical protein